MQFMWRPLCNHSDVLILFLNDSYFRNALCLVADVMNERYTLDGYCRPFGVEITDDDVALRRAGGLGDDQEMSSRERERLADISAMHVKEKQDRVLGFGYLDFEIRLSPTNEVDYRFFVHHERYDSVRERLDMMTRMPYAPRPVQGIPVREIITEILCSNILEYMDTRTLLSWTCACRLSHGSTKTHLLVVFQQLQRDCKILSKILHDRYLREALNLVQSHRENYAHLFGGRIRVDLHDLDIVLMRVGGKDDTDESENLSEVEEERLMFIKAADL